MINRYSKEGSVLKTPKIFESEFRFCEILWDNEPINSTELVKICESILGWKKSTTYTVIRRLSERGVLKNEDSTVTSKISKDDVQISEINELVEKTFNGSLPMFIAAFTNSKELTKEDIAAIREMIDSYEEE